SSLLSRRLLGSTKAFEAVPQPSARYQVVAALDQPPFSADLRREGIGVSNFKINTSDDELGRDRHCSTVELAATDHTDGGCCPLSAQADGITKGRHPKCPLSDITRVTSDDDILTARQRAKSLGQRLP